MHQIVRQVCEAYVWLSGKNLLGPLQRKARARWRRDTADPERQLRLLHRRRYAFT